MYSALIFRSQNQSVQSIEYHTTLFSIRISSFLFNIPLDIHTKRVYKGNDYHSRKIVRFSSEISAVYLRLKIFLFKSTQNREPR